MSLPIGYDNAKHYFEEALRFLKQYEYLYNFTNTDILTENILQHIQIHRLEEANVSLIDKDIRSFQEIKDIMKDVDKLTFEHDARVYGEDNIDYFKSVAVGEKKKQEINNLSEEIHRQCRDIECDTIVDFGCGMGYLDQLLNKNYKYKIIGLENNKVCLKGAEKRQNMYHKESIDHVKYIEHSVSATSNIAIENLLQKHFPKSKKFCIAGLHSCADLTVEAIDIFLNMERARAIVLMPCCYHKMSTSNRKGDDFPRPEQESTNAIGIASNTDVGKSDITKSHQKFNKFPLSKTFKELYEVNNGMEYLRVPFLRLATQPPSVKEDLNILVFRLLSRAVLQLYCHKYKLKLIKKKRRAVRITSQISNFKDYIDEATQNGYLLNCSEHICRSQNKSTNVRKCCCKLQFDTDELTEMWRQTCGDLTFRKAAILILLQRHLQPVFENLILYDRIVYLKEKGIEKCEFVKIINEKVSPRCMALVAIK